MDDAHASIEVWVCVDESGDSEVGKDADEAGERYNENIGESTLARRYVKLTVRVELPRVTELAGNAPLTGQGATLQVG